MECQACTDSLSALLDGELAELERQSVEQHLAACAQCRDEVASLRYCARLTSSLADVDTPTTLWARIEAEIAPLPSGVTAPRTPAEPTHAATRGWANPMGRFFWPTAIAATAAVAFFVALPQLLQPEYPARIQSFLEEREMRYQRGVQTSLASDFDFHKGTSNPFIRVMSHDGSNPFR